MVKTHKITKLFYKEYPYKISYKRLYGFPSEALLEANKWGWWFDVPASVDSRMERSNCFTYLKSFNNIKFMNGSLTHVYFMHKEDYLSARKRYENIQIEAFEPHFDDIKKIIELNESNIEIKKSLYHKKYKYKVLFKFNKNFEDNVGPSIFDIYNDNENYHLNPNIRRFDKSVTHFRTTYNGYSYQFRHSSYNTYAIYCKDRIDMEMVAFVAGENIKTITKAVLIDDLDK
jgi:hypothetical protein